LFLVLAIRRKLIEPRSRSIIKIKSYGKVRSYLEAGMRESMYLRLIEMSNNI
jgi:hypothetical protein